MASEISEPQRESRDLKAIRTPPTPAQDSAAASEPAQPIEDSSAPAMTTTQASYRSVGQACRIAIQDLCLMLFCLFAGFVGYYESVTADHVEGSYPVPLPTINITTIAYMGVWCFIFFILDMAIRLLHMGRTKHSNGTHQENKKPVTEPPAATPAAAKVHSRVRKRTTRKRPQESAHREALGTESQSRKTSTPATGRAGQSNKTHQENERPATKPLATTPATANVDLEVWNTSADRRPRESARIERFKAGPQYHDTSAPTKGPEESNRGESSGVSAGRNRATQTASAFVEYLKGFKSDKSPSTPSERQTGDPIRQNKVLDSPSQHKPLAGTATMTATPTTATQDPVRHYAATYSPLNYKSKTPSKARASAPDPGTSNPKIPVWYCCQCGNGPMAVPIHDSCVNCTVMRCAYCTVEILKKPERKQKGRS